MSDDRFFLAQACINWNDAKHLFADDTRGAAQICHEGGSGCRIGRAMRFRLGVGRGWNH